MKQIRLITVLLLACCPSTAAEQTLTYIDLVQKLTDLEALSVIPQAGERCSQWSSYDRRSRYDEMTGKYVDWDANGDGFGGTGWIRLEGDKRVIAEMKGPGCIWRIWSADPQSGHVRIFLDDDPEPAVDLPFSGYFDGTNEPFTRPALVHTVASGRNCYVPIPYRKSCKVVADPSYGQFYHFTYSTFPEGTVVPTFKRRLTAEEAAALDRADRILQNCGADPAGSRPGQLTDVIQVKAEPRRSATIAAVAGPRAITALRVTMDLPVPVEQQRQVLRELVLQIRWDGETRPSVSCPLGDFFGTTPGVNYYRSLPLGVTKDGFYCCWYMPFSKKALFELVNDGDTNCCVTFHITHAPLTRPVERLGRFHAKWHRDAFLPEQPQRWIDWTMLTTTGAGRFCGVMLHVWNPRGGWWGEGDEKFFVDGEKFPSTFGTGSEDYFGYAWSNPSLFENCYHNQTICENNNKGHVSVNRWHITDNVPFLKSFEACIDKYFPNDRPTLYTCVAYWYLSPDGHDPYNLVPLDQRIGYYVKPVFSPFMVAGINVVREPNGSVERQDMKPWAAGTWTDNEQLWWTQAQPGDKLVVGLTTEKAGKYRLSIRFTKARDYGIVQLYLNDRRLGGPVDLYNPQVIPGEPMDLGVQELAAGEQTLTIEIVGANPAAVKAYMVGIDYVKLIGID
jgi:hypothetical protein